MDKPKGTFKVISLRAENFKRLEAVEIKPDSQIVRVTGPNGAGKTCVLDAIEAAIGGARSEPELPIKQGESKAEIILDLGSIVIERRWRAGKPRQLVVKARDADGVHEHRLARPQQVLDELYSKVAMDPLTFFRLGGEQQRDILAELAGVTAPLQDWQAKHEQAFVERTEVNREVKRLEASCGEYVVARVKHERVNVQELLDEMRAVRARADEARNDRNELNTAVEQEILATEAVERTKAEYDAAQKILSAKSDAIEALRVKQGEKYQKQIQLPDDIPVPNTEELEAKLESAEQINRECDREDQRRELVADLKAKRETADKLSRVLKQIEAAKRKLVEDAIMPVDGLQLGDDGPLWRGLPL